MQRDSLTSLDLHRLAQPDAVVATRVLEDTACGIYPCYYRRDGEHLLVSTAVSALVRQAGRLDHNPLFRPREYLQQPGAHEAWVRATGGVPKGVREWARTVLPAGLLEPLSRNRFWYETWETADRSIRKLRPFECVTPQGSENRFRPDFALRDGGELVERVVARMTAFMGQVEEECPGHEHVVLTGGLDSLLLLLVPKRCPEKWHVFSAEPNQPLVRAWLAENGVRVAGVFGHDNRNEETADETARKIVCADLYSDPRHLRWLPSLRRIAAGFGGRCFFWSGSAGDALHVGHPHHARFVRSHPERFFDIHLRRVPCLVGNYHQAVLNFTGRPLLCPYHTAEIWREVYVHHGPGVIPPGVDLRPLIGERLAGRRLRWPAANPRPAPYQYAERVDAYPLYLAHLWREAEGGGP